MKQQRAEENKPNKTKAQALEPTRPKLRLKIILMLGTSLKRATPNIRGAKKVGVRGDVDRC